MHGVPFEELRSITLVGVMMLGCAHVRSIPTYSQHGRPAYRLECENRGDCLSEAGSRCANAGYDIASESTDRMMTLSGWFDSHWGTRVPVTTMIVECRE